MCARPTTSSTGLGAPTAPRDYVGGNGQDCHGHDTHVAGTAAGQTFGVTPAAQVVSLRLFDCEGEGGEVADIVAALDYIVQQGVRPPVVNMSFGVTASSAVDSATNRVLAAGYTVVAAAGNNGTFSDYISPARVPGVLTVAASDRNDQRPYWSNHGPVVDLYAPGADIRSADHTSNTATKTRNGTSMSAPLVAGVAARLLGGQPSIQPAGVNWALTRNAVQGVISAGSPPPPGWSPGNPPGDPENPEPTENGGPIGIESTAPLLHASVMGQRDGSCVLMNIATNKDIPDAGQGTMTPLPIAGCDTTGM
ncbi:S8 family peptidase [Actinokineospora sp. 24-640]